MRASLLNKKYKKVFLVTFFIFALSVNTVSFVPKTQGCVWGAVSICAAFLKQALELMQRQLEGAIVGGIKVAAIEVLNSKVGQLVGGSSAGQALFISDWRGFLYDTPRQQTDIHMNHVLTLSTRGKGSDYIGVGDDLGNVAGNYVQYLVNQAKNSIAASNSSTSDVSFQYNLDEYGGPDEAFSGNWRAFHAFFENDYNNQFGFTLHAKRNFDIKFEEEKEVAKTKAQSSGFVGPEKDGFTTAPAASIEGLVTNVQSLGNDMIAAASNPAELLAGVVSGAVSRLISNLAQKGIGQVQTNIRREIRNVETQVAVEINRASASMGPAANFSRNINQRTNVNVNTQTPAPPRPTRGGQ